jgi:integrase
LVTVPSRLTGRLRERRQFKTKALAEDWANTQFSGHRKDGHAFFSLSDHERRDVAAVMPELRKSGISLSEAVRFAIKHLRPEGRNRSVKQIVDELTASKALRFERGDLRERSYRDFKERAGRFAGAFEGRIASQVTGEEIKSWLNCLDLGTRSNANYLATVGEVFKLAAQRRYVAFSPLDDLTDTDRKELCGGQRDGREPAILTPDQAFRLISAAQQHPELELFGAVALALFCGVRTEELKRLEWDHVRLSDESPVVTIGAKIAKKRRIRHVEIPANALQWLLLVPYRSGPVARNAHVNDYQKRFQKLLRRAKFKKWEANSMRHSFGSYHYALHGDPLKTSRLLGHKASDQVLFDHYRALATKEEAKRYFEIAPAPQAGKIVWLGSTA